MKTNELIELNWKVTASICRKPGTTPSTSQACSDHKNTDADISWTRFNIVHQHILLLTPNPNTMTLLKKLYCSQGRQIEIEQEAFIANNPSIPTPVKLKLKLV